MKNKINSVLFFVFIFGFSLLCLILPKSDFSESERRVLAPFPEISAERIFGGDFASDFESHTTDTFPFRDAFRSFKAYASQYAFLRADNNKLYSKDGHLSKLEYPMNEAMLQNAADKFSKIHELYLSENTDKIYHSFIPDKNYHLGDLKLPYDELIGFMNENMDYSRYIDIFHLLSAEDYYKTDSHWRQEKISDVAKEIAKSLGADISARFEVKELDTPFAGVYVGQSALNVTPDRIRYISNEILDGATAESIEPGKAEIYDFSKAESRDPYEFFLSGNQAIITVRNPKAENGRRLVLFRDSFASSLTHYLIPAYSEITLVDIRYINHDMLGNFVDFENADVLFLYSTSMLNASTAFK